jgi:hypothetical protein
VHLERWIVVVAVGERDSGDLGGSPSQQCGEPGPVLSAVDLGTADHGKCACRELAAQIAIALFADAAKLVLTPARVLLRHELNLGREIPEGPGIGNARNQCCCQRRTDARDHVQPLAGRVNVRKWVSGHVGGAHTFEALRALATQLH